MNTHVKTITDTLNDAGLSVTLLPTNKLSVSPSDRLTEDLRALIRENKASIIRELQAANQPNITLGTRRPPDLSPKLLAASLALDRQLLEAGISLELPPEPPFRKIRIVQSAQEATPPPRKLDHFHIDAPWRVLAREYYAHHWQCPQCQCAGRGSRYGQRCDVGASLQRIAP
ncbi:MAG: hypothetical protein WCK63_14850 [Betaproteobacteria bacterium]